MYTLQNRQLLTFGNFTDFKIMIFTIEFSFDCKMVVIFGKSNLQNIYISSSYWFINTQQKLCSHCLLQLPVWEIHGCRLYTVSHACPPSGYWTNQHFKYTQLKTFVTERFKHKHDKNEAKLSTTIYNIETGNQLRCLNIHSLNDYISRCPSYALLIGLI